MSEAIDRRSSDIVAPIVGNIWQIQVEIGDRVDAGQTLMILESMKMEIPIPATHAGIVSAIPVKQTEIVQEGDIVAVVQF